MATLRDMQEQYPYIQWVEYVNALLPEPLSVDENETVIVKEPEYLENLGKLLNDTPARVIANYMMWRVVEYSTSFLTRDLRQLNFEYSKVSIGQKKQGEHRKACIDSIGEA